MTPVRGGCPLKPLILFIFIFFAVQPLNLLPEGSVFILLITTGEDVTSPASHFTQTLTILLTEVSLKN